MLKQSLQQKLQQKLSPQQIQLMKLVQLPTVSFEQRIKEELEENPALDDGPQEDENEWDIQQDEYDQNEDIPEVNVEDYLNEEYQSDYKTYSNNYSADDDDKKVPYAQGISFHENLMRQLHTFRLSDEDYLVADFLVGCIDDDGYMRRDLDAISNDMIFTQNISADEEKIEHLLLNYVQKLDPPGIGARSLQECLLIQLKNKTSSPAVERAMTLLEKVFDSFTKKHYKKIMARFEWSEQDLKEAIEEVEKLNPKPGKAFSGNSRIIEHITPDFAIQIVDGELELSLNGRNAPELRISKNYSEMLQTYNTSDKKSKEQKKAVLFVKQKLDAAKWFIDAVNQRRNTLLITMEAIMNMQREYFLSGDERDIKPMILKDIAEKIKMDISTVSRVANSKYVNTPYGTFLIKDLFSESLTNEDGEEVSTREIKRILQDVIENESKRKPLTDEKLAAHLKEKGYPIARRTIAKYREQLNIPVARLRKEI